MVSKSGYVFIDASNIFYGGKGDSHVRIDYQRLSIYLREKYKVKKLFYYSGVESHGYDPTLFSTEEYPIDELIEYLELRISKSSGLEKEYIKKDILRAKFLKKIKTFGYILRLKPVKHIKSSDGIIKNKSNCDVDLTFDVLRLEKEYSSMILLSGDGDFEILLRYLKKIGKQILILSNMRNTANIYKDKYSEELIYFKKITDQLNKKKLGGLISSPCLYISKFQFERGYISKIRFGRIAHIGGSSRGLVFKYNTKIPNIQEYLYEQYWSENKKDWHSRSVRTLG